MAAGRRARGGTPPSTKPKKNASSKSNGWPAPPRAINKAQAREARKAGVARPCARACEGKPKGAAAVAEGHTLNTKKRPRGQTRTPAVLCLFCARPCAGIWEAMWEGGERGWAARARIEDKRKGRALCCAAWAAAHGRVGQGRVRGYVRGWGICAWKGAREASVRGCARARAGGASALRHHAPTRAR